MTDGRQYQALNKMTRIAQETGQYDMTDLSREKIERVFHLSQHGQGAITAIDGVPMVDLCRLALAKKDAEERAQKYQSMLAGYAGTLEELARVHDALGYPMEAACIRGKAKSIEIELNGDGNG